MMDLRQADVMKMAREFHPAIRAGIEALCQNNKRVSAVHLAKLHLPAGTQLRYIVAAVDEIAPRHTSSFETGDDQ